MMRFAALTHITVAVSIALLPPAGAIAQETGKTPLPSFLDGVGQGGGKGLMKADRVSYNRPAKTYSAEGDVEFYYQGRRLFADKVIYQIETGLVQARGNVRLLEANDDVIFAHSLELTDDFAQGVIENISARLGPQARLAGSRAVRAGALTRLENAVYSPCKIGPRSTKPLWQIKADQAEHDQISRDIRYTNPRLEAFGNPVLALPYFEHPDPTVKRRTGFLTPSFLSSSNLGLGTRIPYFVNLAPNRDLTIAPILLTRENPVLNMEYRARTAAGRYRLAAFGTVSDISNNSPLASTKENQFRGAVLGSGLFALDDTTRYGFQIERSTDDTFLRRYKISRDDRLVSRVFIERFEDRDFASAQTLLFQGLRDRDDAGQTPFVFPFIEYNHFFDQPVFGGELSVASSALALTRTDGIDTRRLSGTLRWERPFTFGNGQLVNIFGSVRSDIYNVEKGRDPINPASRVGTGFKARVIPLAGIEWRWPFYRPGETADQVIEPIIQFIATPYGNNSGSIPNEDSAAFEFDETNLFAENKFPGLDQVETGPRFNIGVRYRAVAPELGELTAVFGESFRFRENIAFSRGSGLEDQRSDFVGRLDLSLGDFVDFSHRFRLDKDSLSYRRAEFSIEGGPAWWRTSLNYVRLSQDANTITGDSREEISLFSHLTLDDNWDIRGGFRRDLRDDDMILTRGSIGYHDECFSIEFIVEKDFTRDREVKPVTTFNIRLNLFNLG